MKIIKKECFSTTETRVLEIDDNTIAEINLYLYERVVKNQDIDNITLADLKDCVNNNITETLSAEFYFYVKRSSEKTELCSIHTMVCKYLRSKFVCILPEKHYTPIEILEHSIIK